MVTDGEYTPGRIDSYLSLSLSLFPHIYIHMWIRIYTYIDTGCPVLLVPRLLKFNRKAAATANTNSTPPYQ